jgi:antitoxin ParD1/3/4
MNVSLTSELMNIVHEQVKSGLYNNSSEVVRDAIRQLSTNASLLYELKLSKLRHHLDPSMNQALNREFADYDVNKLLAKLDIEKK